MAVKLVKGGNISLSKSSPNLKRILICLGWEERETAGADFDLDACVFMVGENGKVRRDEDFIFFHQLQSLCGSVEHMGDNTVGGEEQIKVDLEKVPAAAQRLVVTVSIYDADARKQNFGQVSDAFIRIDDQDSGAEIARFDLSEDYSTETAMIFGEIYRRESEWKFKAVGQGFAGGLEALCERFGVSVA
jgi:tellurium resistance protein TerD